MKEIKRLRKFCPDHWDIITFSQAVQDGTAGNSKVKKGQYLKKGSLPVIDQGQELIGGFINDENMLCKEELPCLLFGDHTKHFKYIDQPFALGADGVKVLRPTKGFDKRFLFHYFNTLKLPDNAGYSRHYKFLKEMAVPKPPLPEQKRIAAILDKADAIRCKRQQAIKLADEFLRSVFLDMFGDPVMNPKGLARKPIKELGKVVTGNTPSRERLEYYGRDIEWIKSDNINTPFHFLTVANECLSDEGKQVGRTAPTSSVLVTCIAGTPDCIGNAALADREIAFNQQINAVIPFKGTDPCFLYTQLLVGKRLVRKASTNSMKGLVSKSKFENISLLAPPKETQKAFGAMFSKYIESSDILQKSKTESDALFNSLSQRAFRGEI